MRQYYCKDDHCKAEKATDPACICWHDVGTGRYAHVEEIASTLTWRNKPNLSFRCLQDFSGNNLYEVSGFDSEHPLGKGPLPGGKVYIPFQTGPVPYNGTNGLTMEVLIEIMCHRLEGFQPGPFACERNANALKHLKYARDELNLRTQERIEQGKEGTNKP